jgi:hypothetical protein
MRRQPSQLTQEVIRVLQQYGSPGVDFFVLAQHFGPGVDRLRISKTLANLRARGHAHSECKRASVGGRWFIGRGASDVLVQSPTEFKRIERARQMDRVQPLVFFGQNLIAPRCVSVWTYANSFKESV